MFVKVFCTKHFTNRSQTFVVIKNGQTFDKQLCNTCFINLYHLFDKYIINTNIWPTFSKIGHNILQMFGNFAYV